METVTVTVVTLAGEESRPWIVVLVSEAVTAPVFADIVVADVDLADVAGVVDSVVDRHVCLCSPRKPVASAVEEVTVPLLHLLTRSIDVTEVTFLPPVTQPH